MLKKKIIGILAGAALLVPIVGAPASAAVAAPSQGASVSSDVLVPMPAAPTGKSLPDPHPNAYVKQAKDLPGKFAASKASGGSTTNGGVHPNVTTYFYAGSSQGLTVAGAETSASALIDVKNTSLAAADSHTLAELAVEDNSQAQIVEVGYTKDPATFGDSNVHLFVYHWVNTSGTCYSTPTNLCGFSLYSGRVNSPGDDITAAVGTQKQFGMQYFSGAWWISYNGNWVGSFPASIWTGATPPVTTFTNFRIFQGFGEVAANSTAPCTDMGAGTFPSGTSPARVGSVTYSSGSTAVSLSPYRTNASYYDAANVGASVRTTAFGGPGAC
jgi:hypothetical protein